MATEAQANQGSPEHSKDKSSFLNDIRIRGQEAYDRRFKIAASYHRDMLAYLPKDIRDNKEYLKKGVVVLLWGGTFKLEVTQETLTRVPQQIGIGIYRHGSIDVRSQVLNLNILRGDKVVGTLSQSLIDGVPGLPCAKRVETDPSGREREVEITLEEFYTLSQQEIKDSIVTTEKAEKSSSGLSTTIPPEE